jgi:hypothetical protein
MLFLLETSYGLTIYCRKTILTLTICCSGRGPGKNPGNNHWGVGLQFSEKNGNFGFFRRISICFGKRKTLRIPIRAIPRKIKKSAEFRSERFCEEKKSELNVISFRTIPKKDWSARNTIPNHFVDEKNTQNFIILFRTFPWKIYVQCLEFLFESFWRREKHWKLCSEP